MDYTKLRKEELEKQLEIEQKNYKKLLKKDLSIDITRGKPAKAQLDISMPMLEKAGSYDYTISDMDARNYGELAGIKQIRELFADLFDVKKEQVMVQDGSSLELMYTLIQMAMQFGINGQPAWNKCEKIKFLCPAPGYDRHFSICEAFGIRMITIPMKEDGPDMNLVEQLVSTDDSIKGMWCVPKYSNPTGVVFSDEVVDRIGKMKPAAKDFMLLWDNAYIVHALYDTDEKLKNIFDVAKKAGNENMVFSFASTSKITFCGSGVSAMAASEENIDWMLKRMFFMKINPNKVNQIMHYNYLKSVSNIKDIMKKHAAIIRPKFELFENALSEAFGDVDYVKWTTPKGGYFISFDCKGCAKRIVELAKEAGVKFTPAGSSYPYKQDDANSNIRLAPTVPPIDDLKDAVEVLVVSIKIAKLEQLLA